MGKGPVCGLSKIGRLAAVTKGWPAVGSCLGMFQRNNNEGVSRVRFIVNNTHQQLTGFL